MGVGLPFVKCQNGLSGWGVGGRVFYVVNLSVQLEKLVLKQVP